MQVPLTAAFAATLLFAAPSVSHAQTHVYRFNGTYADQYGGTALVPEGGFLTGNGYSFGANQGLTLSNVFSRDRSYSLVLRSRFDDIGGWRKMVDFQDRSSDNGFYSYFGSADLDPYTLRYAADYVPGVMATSVITRDASDLFLRIYVDGLLRYTITDGGHYANFGAPGGIARFFQDDAVTAQSEATSGFVSYLATYDDVLSDEEVADIHRQLSAEDAQGIVTTPEPGSMALVATGALLAGMARRRRPRR
jgi:hypothetical protein